MKTVGMILIGLVFSLGLFGRLIVAGGLAQYFVFVLTFLTLLLAALTGRHWARSIACAGPMSFERIDEAVAESLRADAKLLQGARPKISLPPNLIERNVSLKTIGASFSSLFMCSILLLGLFGLMSIGSFEYRASGWFGSLMGTAFGKGLATVVAQYIAISAGSFVAAGLFLRFRGMEKS